MSEVQRLLDLKDSALLPCHSLPPQDLPWFQAPKSADRHQHGLADIRRSPVYLTFVCEESLKMLLPCRWKCEVKMPGSLNRALAPSTTRSCPLPTRQTCDACTRLGLVPCSGQIGVLLPTLCQCHSTLFLGSGGQWQTAKKITWIPRPYSKYLPPSGRFIVRKDSSPSIILNLNAIIIYVYS